MLHSACPLYSFIFYFDVDVDLDVGHGEGAKPFPQGDPLPEQVISVRLLSGDLLGSYEVASMKTVAQLKCLKRTFSVQDEKMSGEGGPLLD